MIAQAAAVATADVIAFDPLPFVTTDSALAAYRVAKLSGSPAAFRDAAHKLARVVERMSIAPVAKAAQQAENGPGVDPGAEVQPAKRRGRPPGSKNRPKGENLAAPMGNIPRKREAVGSFTCTYADGSEVHVSAVTYHAGKPETRFAAAAQAADRLRRARAAREALNTMGGADFAPVHMPSLYTFGPCNLRIFAPSWATLTASRDMPELREIMCEDTCDVHTAAPGQFVGDAARAAVALANLTKRVHPLIDAPAGEPLNGPYQEGLCGPVRPAAVVIPLPISPAVYAAREALEVARKAHRRAAMEYSGAARPSHGSPAALERQAALYAAECAAFSAFRAAGRHLAAVAA